MLESRTAAESRFRGGLEGAPDPIVLHVANLPRKDGREVLPDIKADPDLKTIPVVVLTTSRADQDVLQTYALQANCYIIKPLPHKP